jgi:hypothetical protein
MLLALFQAATASPTPIPTPMPLPIHTLWYQDPIILSSVVIAVATVVNLFVSVHLARSTRDSAKVTQRIFEAAYRPYLAISVQHAEMDEAANQFKIIFQINNVGAVPAHDVDISWHVIINGEPFPPVEMGYKKSTLFPQAIRNITTRVTESKQYLSIKSGAKVEIEVSATYKGIAGEQHDTYHKEVYDRDKGFLLLEQKAS